MHTLYWSADTGAFVVQVLLEELGLPYERVVIDTKLGEHRRPEFLALNPLAQVPVLRLPDGTVMTETGAMLLHLCDSRPEAGLFPEPGTPERAAAYRWLFLMATGLYETDLRWYYPERYTADGSWEVSRGRPVSEHSLDVYGSGEARVGLRHARALVQP